MNEPKIPVPILERALTDAKKASDGGDEDSATWLKELEYRLKQAELAMLEERKQAILNG